MPVEKYLKLDSTFKKYQFIFRGFSFVAYDLLKFFMLFTIFIVAVGYILISAELSEKATMIVGIIMKIFYSLIIVGLICAVISLYLAICRKINNIQMKRKNKIEVENAKPRKRSSRKSR